VDLRIAVEIYSQVSNVLLAALTSLSFVVGR
jgi:hypothetical protein